LKTDKAEFVRSALDPTQFPRDGRPEVAFIGRSNVGKSSLLNRLLGRRKLARTSSTPGRTRAINFFLIDERYYFVDLPGYGYARAGKQERAQWAGLIDQYLRRPAFPGRVVLLIDGKVGATDLDVEAYRYLEGLRVPTLLVATKIDRVPRGQRVRQLAAIRGRLGLSEDQALVSVSAETGEGTAELWRALELARRAPAEA
jgi:GTP-binding protein